MGIDSLTLAVNPFWYVAISGGKHSGLEKIGITTSGKAFFHLLGVIKKRHFFFSDGRLSLELVC
jgi:hypothetical protein